MRDMRKCNGLIITENVTGRKEDLPLGFALKGKMQYNDAMIERSYHKHKIT